MKQWFWADCNSVHLVYARVQSRSSAYNDVIGTGISTLFAIHTIFWWVKKPNFLQAWYRWLFSVAWYTEFGMRTKIGVREQYRIYIMNIHNTNNLSNVIFIADIALTHAKRSSHRQRKTVASNIICWLIAVIRVIKIWIEIDREKRSRCITQILRLSTHKCDISHVKYGLTPSWYDISIEIACKLLTGNVILRIIKTIAWYLRRFLTDFDESIQWSSLGRFHIRCSD